MGKILLIFSLILIIIISHKVYENFDIIKDGKLLNPNTNCCLVQKKYVNDSGGKFKYLFEKMENKKCDSRLYNSNSNQQLLFDGNNGWNNIYCDENNNILGSCRRTDKECVDFVTKDFCDKYEMKWSNKTCHDLLDYVWEDKINYKLPNFKDNGSFVMFKKWN